MSEESDSVTPPPPLPPTRVSPTEPGPPKPKRKREKMLKSQVLKQLEFYFSDVNLHKSRFMKEKLFPSESPCGNPVQIATLLTFNKLIAMGATQQVRRQEV